MGLPSIYESPGNEEEMELFRLVDPDQHPEMPGDDTAAAELEMIEADGYQAYQDEQDAAASLPPQLMERLQRLSPDELDEVARFIQELTSGESDG